MKKVYSFFLILVIGLAVAIAVTAFNNPSGNPTSGGGIIGVGSGAPASSLYIDSLGNVGIGMTNPQQLLHLEKAGAVDNRIRLAAGGPVPLGLEFVESGLAKGYVQRESGDKLAFYAGGGSAADRKMVILDTGNVGIGMTVPGVSLDVNGGVRAGSNTVVTACGSGQAAGEGAQRYNYTTHKMEYCNGSGWVSPGGDTASIGTNGYTKLASGLIIQWGSVSAVAFPANNGGTFGTVTFPLAFPNGVFSVVPTLVGNYPGPNEWQDHSVKVGNITTSNFVIWVAAPNNGGYGFTYTAQWIATGY